MPWHPARLRSLIAATKASYWFYPALSSLLAVGLSFLTVYLDRRGWARDLSQMQSISPARPQGASEILTVIAGSTIGVGATVFSITIAAVAYASSTYGPRLLTNFMEDRGNQLSLGTFIGTFVYSLMVLRVVRAEDERGAAAPDTISDTLPGFVPQLSLMVATGLMLTSIAVLVFFLNHIPSSIRINTVIEQIGRRLLRQVRDRFPREGKEVEREELSGGEAISATGEGYIEIIDFAGLEEIANDAGGVIVLDVEAGFFVHPPHALARLIGVELDEKTAKAIRGCFALSGLRTPTQDLRFLLDELVEIALRALSPGVNDPFTAVTALHWIGAATAEIGGRVITGPSSDGKERQRVVPVTVCFADFVAGGFGSARSAVATSRKATLAMYDALERCAEAIRCEKRLAVLREEGAQLLGQAVAVLTGPDLAEVQRRYRAYSVAAAPR